MRNLSKNFKEFLTLLQSMKDTNTFSYQNAGILKILNIIILMIITYINSLRNQNDGMVIYIKKIISNATHKTYNRITISRTTH